MIGLALAAVLPSEGIEWLFCLFHEWTHLPCPFCGLTRSMSSFVHFEFTRSLSFHPMGGLMVFIFGYYAIRKAPGTSRGDGLLLIVLVCLFVFFWMLRILGLLPGV